MELQDDHSKSCSSAFTPDQSQFRVYLPAVLHEVTKQGTATEKTYVLNLNGEVTL